MPKYTAWCYYTHDIIIMLKNVNKMVVLKPLCVCVCVGVCQQPAFSFFVRQPVGFCILNQRANHSASFSCVWHVTSWWDASWQNAACILQFVRCDHAVAEGWLMWGRGPPEQRFKNSQQQTFTQRRISGTHVLWNLHSWYTIWWCNSVCCV